MFANIFLEASPTVPEDVKKLKAPGLIAGMGMGSEKSFESVELGAIGYYYKNAAATDSALRRFREHYPVGDISVLADGGVDYKATADKYGAAYYEYSENLSVKWSTPAKAFAWAERLNRGINAIRQRWILILEDDVYVRRRVREAPHGNLVGMRPYCILKLSSTLSAWIREQRKIRQGKRPTAKDTWKPINRYGYSGCGGCILDGDFWRANYNSSQVLADITEMFERRPIGMFDTDKVLHSDIMVSALILLWGGNILPSGEWTEPKYKDHKGDFAILHDYKEDYTKESIQKGVHQLN